MRDVRLALPVGIAWTVLAALSAHAQMLGTAAVIAAAVAIACLARRPRDRARPARPRIRCAAHRRAGSRALKPAAAGGRRDGRQRLRRVRRAVAAAARAAPHRRRCSSPAATARRPRRSVSSAAPCCSGHRMQSLAIGGTATGTCSAWLDGSRWLLTCSDLEVSAPSAWLAWAGPLRDGLLDASAQLPGAGRRAAARTRDRRRTTGEPAAARRDARDRPVASHRSLGRQLRHRRGGCLPVGGGARCAPRGASGGRCGRARGVRGAGHAGAIGRARRSDGVDRAARHRHRPSRRRRRRARRSPCSSCWRCSRTSRRAPASRCRRSRPAASSCTGRPSRARSHAGCRPRSPRSSRCPSPRSCGACPCSSRSTPA